MADSFNFSSLKKALRNRINQNTKNLALDILDGAVDRSRLDTGKTRNNWELTLEAPFAGERDAIESGDRKSSARLKSNTEAPKQRARQAIKGFDLTTTDFVFITNNVDYFASIWNNVDSTALLALRNALARSKN